MANSNAGQKPRNTRMLSATTVQVSVAPYNPEELKKQLNFVVDYQKQQKVVPKGFVTGLGRGGPGSNGGAMRATNESGAPPFKDLNDVISDGQNDPGEF